MSLVGHRLSEDLVRVIVTTGLLQLCPNVSTEDSQWCTQDFILGDINLTQLHIY